MMATSLRLSLAKAICPHSRRNAMAPVNGKLIPTDNTAVYIVTGGNRGLGIEHVKQFLEKTDAKVVATARQPSKADELNALSKKYADRLSVVELDTGSETSIEAAAKQVSSLHPEGVDLILNNAGCQEPVTRAIETTGKEYLKVLQVNVVGPFLVTLHFLPLLRKKQTRAVVHTSSICGSIAGARKGMFGGNIIAYNSSKAAVNMQIAIFANDLEKENFTFLSLHPGWVQTDMGHAGEALGVGSPPLDPQTSIAGQHKVILSLSHEQNGQFLDWEGKQVEY